MAKLMVFTVVAGLLLANVNPSELNLRCWTRWYNRDDPRGRGDWEDLKNLRLENPGQICPRPMGIQAVTVDGEIPAENTGQYFYAYNTQIGFICRNEDQENEKCLDYKVRFQCPCFPLCCPNA